MFSVIELLKNLAGSLNTLLAKISPSLDGIGMGVIIALALTASVLFNLLFFKRYKLSLKRNYGFNLMGAPAILSMISYSIASFSVMLGGGAALTEQYPAIVGIIMLLGIGAPGILWMAVTCIRKTGDYTITMVNILLMYLVTFVLGYVFAGLVALLLLLRLMKFITRHGEEEVPCEYCGKVIPKGSECPYCEDKKSGKEKA